MDNTKIRKSYSDNIKTDELWFNKSFTDEYDFQKERFLLHLERGDIKIKFMEVPNKFKKLDGINITKPFVIYAMRRNGLTRKGKESFTYNKSLSIYLSSMIADSMKDVDDWSHYDDSSMAAKSSLESHYYSWFADNNGMLEEWEFLKNFIKKKVKKTNRSWSACLTSHDTYKEVAKAWKLKTKRRAKLTEAEWKLVDQEPFKLNHKFALWYALFDEEVITAEQVKKFLLNKYAWRATAFNSTIIKPQDDYQTRAAKMVEREKIVKRVITDPIFFKFVSKEDMEDKDFAIHVLSASKTLSNYNSGKNGNNSYHSLLAFFPESIRDNEEVVLFDYAITSSIFYASDRLKSDRQFILGHGIDISEFSDELRNDFEFIKIFIEKHNPSDSRLNYVGDQLANNLDYIEWLMNFKYSGITQQEIDRYDRVIVIGSEIFDQCRDSSGNFQLELLNNLLEKNRFKKRLQLDLNKGKTETRSGKIKI
ncbi:hypothetical protein A9Y76_07130 [Ralstonia insidiosa]|uniref:Uncharacterized protein n=2 Tax=Ralstonia insidiosa TaxID=190721 RepID=A0A191ZVZ0_9RALS|nr:hypothetical protein A9Y76_07130 [Ralstonia insidiosa]